MLNAERACVSAYWSGDLREFATRVWQEDSTIVAIGIAADGQARAWLNLRHVHPGTGLLLWLRLRHAMRRRPFAVLYASDLAPLLADDGYADLADAGC